MERRLTLPLIPLLMPADPAQNGLTGATLAQGTRRYARTI